MDKCRKSAHIAAVELRKAFTGPRFYVALLWILFDISSYVVRVKEFSALAGIKVSPWLFPLIIPDAMGQLFVIIGATLIFCDAPFINSMTTWQLMRGGRKSLFGGHILYIWVMSLLYAAALALLPNLILFPRVAFMKDWGQVLGALAQSSAAAQMGINPPDYNLMARFMPMQAMALTILAVWLNSVLVGMINYACNLCLRKGIGPLISIVMGLSPYLIIRLADFWVGYYLAPPAWMNITMYSWDGYGTYPTPVYIYAVLLGLIFVCMTVSYIGIRRKDINTASGF